MTSTNKAKPVLVAAMTELVALAVAVRPDWTADQATAALVDAKTCGMTWAQALVGMARLIVDLDAKPGELIPHHLDMQRSAAKLAAKPAALGRHAGELTRAREDCALASAKLRADENAGTP